MAFDWTHLVILVMAIAAGLAGQVILGMRRDRRQRESLRAILMTEMRSAATRIREEHYIQQLLSLSNPAASSFVTPLSARLGSHYGEVFRANTAKLALLPPDEATQIVLFHHLVDSVMVDTLGQPEARDARHLAGQLRIALNIVATLDNRRPEGFSTTLVQF